MLEIKEKLANSSAKRDNSKQVSKRKWTFETISKLRALVLKENQPTQRTVPI